MDLGLSAVRGDTPWDSTWDTPSQSELPSAAWRVDRSNGCPPDGSVRWCARAVAPLAWEVDILADLKAIEARLSQAGSLVGASDHGIRRRSTPGIPTGSSSMSPGWSRPTGSLLRRWNVPARSGLSTWTLRSPAMVLTQLGGNRHGDTCSGGDVAEKADDDTVDDDTVGADHQHHPQRAW